MLLETVLSYLVHGSDHPCSSGDALMVEMKSTDWQLSYEHGFHYQSSYIPLLEIHSLPRLECSWEVSFVFLAQKYFLRGGGASQA